MHQTQLHAGFFITPMITVHRLINKIYYIKTLNSHHIADTIPKKMENINDQDYLSSVVSERVCYEGKC